MWIKDLMIKNFGRFQQKNISFGSGLNLIYGENESGKTTLHTSIKGCLYGIRKMRGRGARTDVYTRYQPWENPAWYAASLRFECGEKTFRLDRDFAGSEQDTQLVCETDGELLSIPEGDLDILLGDVSETVFENTVYIAQTKSFTDEGLAQEMQNYMANSQAGRDGALDLQKAMNYLRENRKEISKKQSEDNQKIASQLQEYEIRKQYIQEDMDQNQGKLEQCKTKLEEIYRTQGIQKDQGSEEIAEISETEDGQSWEEQGAGKGNSWKWVCLICLDVLAIFALLYLSLFQMENRTLGMVIGLIGAGALTVATVFLLLGQRRKRQARARNKIVNYKANNKENQAARLQWNIEQLQQEIQENKIVIENIEADEEALRDQNVGTQDEEIQALDLAAKTIDNIVQHIRSDIGQQLKIRTSQIFSEITEGKYTKIQLDDSLKPGVHTSERYVPLEQLSRGTMEQLYFSLRMAAAEILCKEEIFPVILDDVFAMYDEIRLAQTLKWLAAQKKQILIFTCQKREEEILLQMGLSYCKIEVDGM